jgi:hypothetical protein
MTGEVFRAYIEQLLAPTLGAGDAVVMDNLPAPKVAGVREAIRAVEAGLPYLPPYSPDLGPIAVLTAMGTHQPDRAALRQAQDLAAQGRRPQPRGAVDDYRRPPR